MYDTLLKRNVNKEELDKNWEIYVEFETQKRNEQIKEQEIREKCLRKEKRNNWFKKFKNRGKY